MTQEIGWSGDESKAERALGVAADYARASQRGALLEADQAAAQLDGMAGALVWRDGRHVTVWPDAVADRAGLSRESPRRQRSTDEAA